MGKKNLNSVNRLRFLKLNEERKKKIEVIKRMLKDNVDIGLIKKYVGATEEETF